MPEQAEKSDLEFEQIHERLHELERRVEALERHSESPPSPSPATFLGPKPKKAEKRVAATDVVQVLGKAVLGVAGAYLLRAIAESGAAPRWVLLMVATGYAAGWLVWAARKHQKSHFASMVFAGTAAFILAPLLWECTVRFQDLKPGFASAVLVGYFALSLALTRRKQLEAIPWIAVVTAVGTALALLVATHEVSTLTVGLLAIALITESAARSGRWPGVRTLSALGADFAVGVLGIVMTSPEGVPASYPPMSTGEINALCIALPLIYCGSLGVRGFGMLRKWTLSEVAQATLAFVLGTWVSLRATRGAAATVLGAISLVLALACYWGALKRFAGLEMRRNRRVCTNYAAGLTLAGIFLVFGGNLRSVSLSLAALAAVVVFTRTGYLSVGIHGTLYLLAASILCGLFEYAGRALAGTVPAWPEWSFWTVAAAGSVSYIIGSRARGEGWKARVLWVVPAAVVGFAVAALMVAGMAGLGVVELSVSRLSMVRTVVTCLMALGFGYAGSRWNRVELGWLAYGAIALGALKLALEDLRFGNPGTLMVSLLFYGLILILLPTVTRFGRVEI
jgi:hypothetical protein